MDQLVTVDYNARNYTFVETIDDQLLDKLLMKVKAFFQKTNVLDYMLEVKGTGHADDC